MIREAARTAGSEAIRARGLTLIGISLTNLVPGTPAKLPLPLEHTTERGSHAGPAGQVRLAIGHPSRLLGMSELSSVPRLPG